MNIVVLSGKINYIDKDRKFFLLTNKNKDSYSSYPCKYFSDNLKIENGKFVVVRGRLYEKDKRVIIIVDSVYVFFNFR